MPEEKFVSFIIPVLNGESAIGKCLEAIQNLDYPKGLFEIIIADNGSKDNTLEIAKKYTSNIFVDTTATIAKLRNKGTKMARGGFFAFVDSDCVIPRDWLRIAFAYFEKKDVAMVGAKTYNLPDGSSWWKKAWKIHLDRKIKLKEVMWLISESIIVRKDAFLSVGGFNESLRTCEDVDFGYNMRKKYKIISDERLAPIHMEKARTLSDFFRKEVWRSKGNIANALNHLDEPKEIMGLVYVFYYLVLLAILLPSLIMTFVVRSPVYFFVVLLGLAIPLLIVSFDTCRRTAKYSYFFKLFIVYGVYVLAKVRAIFK